MSGNLLALGGKRDARRRRSVGIAEHGSFLTAGHESLEMRRIREFSGMLMGAVLAACAHTGGSATLPTGFAPGYAARPDAGSFKSIYSFKTLPDAEVPSGGLIAPNGTLFGTTFGGGKVGAGAVFASSTAGKERVIHSFGGAGDGMFPNAGLVALNGTFYGTASNGGAVGFGAVFKVDKTGA